MFFLRQARPTDLDTLFKLAKTVYFTNLPADREGIADRIRWSQQSFLGGQPAVGLGRADATWNGSARAGAPTRGVGGAGGRSPHYMFVLEDDETGQALGTSAIIAEMGAPGNPNVFLRLRRRETFSSDLQSGMTHVTAQVVAEENGPTEIGGLILGASFRGGRLGRQLSFVRFHFIGLHRERFKDRILAEMMGPISPDGVSPFWENFGRRFINLPYHEADLFCQKSREFMLSLLPREEIYLTLLSADARAAVGKVGPETIPARRLLERAGFRYEDRIDPFDGGPHLTAPTEELPLVRDTRRTSCAGPAQGKLKQYGIVSREDLTNTEDMFRAVFTEYAETPDGSGVRIPAPALRALRAEAGVPLGLTPMGAPEATPAGSRAGRAKAARAPGDTKARKRRGVSA